MQPTDQADELHEAIERLKQGQPLQAVSETVSPEVAPLLASAARLHAASLPGGLRPSFVLGLEEQLRTDLRLRPPTARVGRSSRTPWIASGAVVAVAVLGLAAVRLGGSGGGLSSWRTAAENVLLGALPWSESRVEHRLDVGWERLDAASALVQGDPADDADLRRALADMADAYVAALSLARRSGREPLVDRAEAETGAALAMLGGLLTRGSPAEAEQIRWYANRIHRHVPLVTMPALASRAPRSSMLPAPGPTDPIAPTLGAPPTAVPPLATATTSPALPTVGLPTATGSPPSPAPSSTAQPTSPPATTVREKPTAVATRLPDTATPVSHVVTPTPTRDDHVQPTSTPPPTIVVPISTVEPSATPMVAVTPVAPTRAASTPVAHP